MIGATPCVRGHRRPLLLYGLTHAAVDATSSALVFSSLRGAEPSVAVGAVVLYNVAAFAVQPFVGLLLDRRPRPQRAAALGGFVVAAGALLLATWPQSYILALWAGLGNAVFHVGCGIPVLRMTPGRAGAVGLFVAPGALGLGLGVAVGRAGGPVWLLAVVLAALCVPVWRGVTRDGLAPVASGTPASTVPAVAPGAPTRAGIAVAGRAAHAGRAEWVVTALLAVVATRAFVGTALVFPWRSVTALLVGLTIAAAVGKAAGGLLADRFGRARIGVGALLLAIPLLVVGPASAAAGIAGVFLVNLTMPITLAETADRLPGHEGFGFGLTCLALIMGAFPTYLGVGQGGVSVVSVTALLVVAAALLAWAVRTIRWASFVRGSRTGETTVREGVT